MGPLPRRGRCAERGTTFNQDLQTSGAFPRLLVPRIFWKIPTSASWSTRTQLHATTSVSSVNAKECWAVLPCCGHTEGLISFHFAFLPSHLATAVRYERGSGLHTGTAATAESSTRRTPATDPARARSAERTSASGRGHVAIGGSVSEEAMTIAASLGVNWMACGEGVLGRSTGRVFGETAEAGCRRTSPSLYHSPLRERSHGPCVWSSAITPSRT
jgi:hypothetical protein